MKEDFARRGAPQERTESSNRDDSRRAPKTDISTFSKDRRPRVSTPQKVERKPFGDRRQETGDRKPFGDRRPQTGERKPFDRERKPFDGERKPFDRDNRPQGERRSFNPNFSRENRPFSDRRQGTGERKPFDRERKPFDGERRPFNSDRKPFDRDRRPQGEHKPFDRERKPFDGERKPFERRPQGERPTGFRQSSGERRFKPKYPSNRTFTPRPEYDSTNYPKFEAQQQAQEIRLNRYISMSGICSRREADELIASGAVMVDGVVITELGTKISTASEVRVNDKQIKNEQKVYLLLNKPKGYVTSLEDPHAEKTVMDLIKDSCTERVYPVGRLDKNSLGVLLFTNDGDLSKQLTHPSYEKKKVYQVTLDKPITKADMEQIVAGITLDDGEIHADEISWVGTAKTEVGIEIHSGRNRIVRRIFEHMGYTVRKLDRVYFAGLTKAKLKRGQWRFLSPREVEILRSGRYE